MKLSVDRKLCLASGLCTGLAPEVFELDDAGLLVLLDEHPGEEFAADVEEAVRSCPFNALKLEKQ